MQAHAGDEPAAGLFYQAVVVVTRVEEVVGLYVELIGACVPGEACVGQTVGAVVADAAVEVGVGTYAILPSDHHAEFQHLGQPQTEVANEFMAQVFEGVLRHDMCYLLLVLVDITVTEFQVLQHALTRQHLKEVDAARDFQSDAVDCSVVDALPHGLAAF